MTNISPSSCSSQKWYMLAIAAITVSVHMDLIERDCSFALVWISVSIRQSNQVTCVLILDSIRRLLIPHIVRFLLRDATLARYMLWPCLCPSVTSQQCTIMAKHKIMKTTLRNSWRDRSFLMPKFEWCNTQNWQFWQYLTTRYISLTLQDRDVVTMECQ